MRQASTIGLDIAKRVFQAHGADASGHAVFRKRLVRAKLLAFFAAQPPCTVAMEACAGVVQGSGSGAEAQGDVGDRPPTLRMPFVPSELNQDRRHHIPRQRRRVTNSLGALLRSWPAYDASLRQRGSLAIWLADSAIAGWAAEPRTTRGGQPWYSGIR